MSRAASTIRVSNTRYILQGTVNRSLDASSLYVVTRLEKVSSILFEKSYISQHFTERSKTRYINFLIGITHVSSGYISLCRANWCSAGADISLTHPLWASEIWYDSRLSPVKSKYALVINFYDNTGQTSLFFLIFSL